MPAAGEPERPVKESPAHSATCCVMALNVAVKVWLARMMYPAWSRSWTCVNLKKRSPVGVSVTVSALGAVGAPLLPTTA